MYHSHKKKTSEFQTVEGRNPCIEVLRSVVSGKRMKSSIVKLYLERDIKKDDKISEVVKISEDLGLSITYIDRKSLDKISKSETHQGVILEITNRGFGKLKDLIESTVNSGAFPYFILIRETLYEHNLGAILRTAACSGANGIILTPKSEISPNVIRASMGATEYLNIVKSSFFEALDEMKSNNIKIVGIEMVGTKFHYEADLKGPICLVIGGEDHSLSQEIIAKCDECVKIPMLSSINSLNMSVAAAVVMYEKVRQELI